MARIFGSNADGTYAEIDQKAVADFFEVRAHRISTLGPVRAVIYQDKHPDLAERRDAAERAVLAPLLRLNGEQRLLDVGCGTGRWLTTLYPQVAAYHGIDLTPGLIDFATREFSRIERARFTVAPANAFTLDSLGEQAGFDRVLSAGVLIYLNDDQLMEALECIRDSLEGPFPRLLFREPTARVERLTITQHYSDDLDQEYNAIYRTREDLFKRLTETFRASGLSVLDNAPVFEADELNNRVETQQEWFLIGRAE